MVKVAADVAIHVARVCYRNGVGMYPDLLKAAELYQKACDQGTPSPPQSHAFRSRWSAIAYLNFRFRFPGHAMAQYTLGKQCMSGRGIPQDVHKAIGTALSLYTRRPHSCFVAFRRHTCAGLHRALRQGGGTGLQAGSVPARPRLREWNAIGQHPQEPRQGRRNVSNGTCVLRVACCKIPCSRAHVGLHAQAR